MIDMCMYDIPVFYDKYSGPRYLLYSFPPTSMGQRLVSVRSPFSTQYRVVARRAWVGGRHCGILGDHRRSPSSYVISGTLGVTGRSPPRYVVRRNLHLHSASSELLDQDARATEVTPGLFVVKHLMRPIARQSCAGLQEEYMVLHGHAPRTHCACRPDCPGSFSYCENHIQGSTFCVANVNIVTVVLISNNNQAF